MKADSITPSSNLPHERQGGFLGLVEKGIIIDSIIAYAASFNPSADFVGNKVWVSSCNLRAQDMGSAVGAAERTSSRGLYADISQRFDEVEEGIWQRIEIIHVRNESRVAAPELFEEIEDLEIPLA